LKQQFKNCTSLPSLNGFDDHLNGSKIAFKAASRKTGMSNVCNTLKQVVLKAPPYLWQTYLLTYLLTHFMMQDIFEKLIVTQFAKKILFFMEPEGSLPC
jgi:hypothetical protein